MSIVRFTNASGRFARAQANQLDGNERTRSETETVVEVPTTERGDSLKIY